MKNFLPIVIMLLVSCSQIGDQGSISIPREVESFVGLDDVETILGRHFNPLKGVSIITDTGEDYANRLQLKGKVDFSQVGTYTLQYALDEGPLTFERTRTVNVVQGTYVSPTNPKTYTSYPFEDLGEGSYRTGPATDIAHPVNPQFMEADLLDRPVPTNQWWTALAMSNYGGSDGIYNNPLRSSFSNDGVEVTQSGKGFTQFWNPEGNQTNPPAQVGNPTHEDRYFLLSVPKNSLISISNTNHPFGFFHRLSIEMGDGNLMSFQFDSQNFLFGSWIGTRQALVFMSMIYYKFNLINN